MRVVANLDRCEGYGLCQEAAPQLFGSRADGRVRVLHDPVPADDEGAARCAVRVCPLQTLTIAD